MPNESQAQLAKYFVSSTMTTCWVATPGKRRSHPNRYSVGFQHQHSLSAQREKGFANAADVAANTFSYNFHRWPLPGLCEMPVNRQFRLRIKTHKKDINL